MLKSDFSILIILIPSIIQIFENKQSLLSLNLIEFFSILIICYIIKLLNNLKLILINPIISLILFKSFNSLNNKVIFNNVNIFVFIIFKEFLNLVEFINLSHYEIEEDRLINRIKALEFELINQKKMINELVRIERERYQLSTIEEEEEEEEEITLVEDDPEEYHKNLQKLPFRISSPKLNSITSINKFSIRSIIFTLIKFPININLFILNLLSKPLKLILG